MSLFSIPSVTIVTLSYLLLSISYTCYRFRLLYLSSSILAATEGLWKHRLLGPAPKSFWISIVWCEASPLAFFPSSHVLLLVPKPYFANLYLHYRDRYPHTNKHYFFSWKYVEIRVQFHMFFINLILFNHAQSSLWQPLIDFYFWSVRMFTGLLSWRHLLIDRCRWIVHIQKQF